MTSWLNGSSEAVIQLMLMPKGVHAHGITAGEWQCLAGSAKRNASRGRIKWIFTTAQERRKLTKHYPEPAKSRNH
jgi:hypothetical protein